MRTSVPSNPMKYESEIKSMLDHVFKKVEEPWMDEVDKRQLREETLAAMPLETMNAQIEKGVANGYSAERQMEIMQKFFATIVKPNQQTPCSPIST